MRELLGRATCWTETEFAHLELGDARLNNRARTLMERLAAKPTAGVVPRSQWRWRTGREGHLA
ncbi:hypothetical protein DIE23_33260 [Burkholderia sp. Bp9143]|nr:transposase DNA-binding-containing protein [Burkholderia sp. Bp9143]RQR24893.1 hypothetical protein DIE23_33260 [Burkholderia sp. Bp9143]